MVGRQATAGERRFSVRRPLTRATAALVAAVLVGGLLLVAGSLDRGLPAVAVAAAVLAAAAYWRLSRYYGAWAIGADRGASTLQLLLGCGAGAGLCALGAAVLAHGSTIDSRVLASIGVGVVAVGLIPVMHAIRYEPHRDRPRPWSEAVIGWELNIFFAFASLTPALLIVGAPAAIALGVPAAWVLSVAVNRASRERWYRRLVPGLVLLLLASLFAFFVWSRPGEHVLEVVIALVVALGMVDALSAPTRESERRYGWTPERTAVLVLLACAAALVVGVMSQTSLRNVSLVIAVPVGALALGFGAAFVHRGQGLAVLAIVAVVTAFVVADRTDRAPETATAHGQRVIVALGDSYTSGEGADRFFAGTNVTKGNDCRRSSNSYAYRVAQSLQARLVFLACSGALAENIWKTGQIKHGGGTEVGALPQLANPVLKDLTPDLVLISIGGNDALFGAIGRGCALPGRCTDISQVFDGNLGAVRPTVAAALDRVADRFPQSPIVLVPYPQMLADRLATASLDQSCPGVPFDGFEVRYLHGFVEQLDDQVERAAVQVAREDRFVTYFGAARSAYAGSQVCQGAQSVAINTFKIAPTEANDLFTRLVPTNWLHDNFHPNQHGQELMAAELQQWISDNVPNFGSAARLPPPAPIRSTSGASLRVCTDRAACITTVNHWSTGKTIDALRSVAIPVLMLLALGWLLGAIRRLPLLWPHRSIRGRTDQLEA